MMLADYNEEELPLYACFGRRYQNNRRDGPGSAGYHQWYCCCTPLGKGDFVVLDNMLVAHGRKAYTGDRQTVVSMAP